jgi:hypothetical protein
MPLTSVFLAAALFAPLGLQAHSDPISSLSQVASKGKAQVLLLHLDGNVDGVRLSSAWKRSFPYQQRRQTQEKGIVLVRDRAGRDLAKIPVELSFFNLHTDGRKGKLLVHGDHVEDPHLSLLVKIPDLGDKIAQVLLVDRTSGKDRVLMQVSSAVLKAALARSLTPLAGPIIKTHQNNGPVGNRYDIVVLGDGYRASEQARFYSDISRWMNDLFAREPFKSYRKFFNVHSVFRASVESGADQPDKNPPIYKNTVYNASYNIGGTPRCLYIRNTSLASKDAALAPDVEGRVVVFVNSSRYGGCASTFAVSYNGSLSPKVQSHEFGHSFGLLADEYDYGRSGTYSGPEPSRANLTKDKTGKTKWPLWMGYNGIGTYEGGGYYKKGLYRPKVNCLMRSLGAPLCEICVEQELKQGYKTVNPIENARPSSASLTITKPGSQTFSFSNLVPGAVQIRWTVDGILKRTGSTSFLFASASYSAGLHTVKVEVTDKTSRVRKDPTKLLVRSRSWLVTVKDTSGGKPDLYATLLSSNSTFYSGSNLLIRTSVRNGGTANAGTFTVGHFLSTNTIISTLDTYLGAYTVRSLAKGVTSTYSRNTFVPYQLDRRIYYLASWIDREGRVSESSERNNIRMNRVSVLGPRGCVRRLEYRNPLQLSYVGDRISLSAGGVRRMIISAPCNKNHWALVLWTCRGTNPGIRLPGGFHLPLNYDSICTSFGLAVLNRYPFYGFFSKVGTTGHTYQSVFVPKAPNGVRPIRSNFAALFFSPNFASISGTTNAVTFDLIR